MLNITKLERDILKNWFHHTCAAMGGKTVEDIRGDNFSWAVVTDIKGDHSVETAKGVCGSLAKRGIIDTDGESMFLTDIGLDVIDLMFELERGGSN